VADSTLEARVAKLEQAIGELQQRVPPVQPAGLMSVAGIFKDDPGFADVVEYGRYYRETGRLPPPGWKPGDPIPDVGDAWGDDPQP
jgi:hypothetical protein